MAKIMLKEFLSSILPKTNINLDILHQDIENISITTHDCLVIRAIGKDEFENDWTVDERDVSFDIKANNIALYAFRQACILIYEGSIYINIGKQMIQIMKGDIVRVYTCDHIKVTNDEHDINVILNDRYSIGFNKHKFLLSFNTANDTIIWNLGTDECSRVTNTSKSVFDVKLVKVARPNKRSVQNDIFRKCIQSYMSTMDEISIERDKLLHSMAFNQVANIYKQYGQWTPLLDEIFTGDEYLRTVGKYQLNLFLKKLK